MAARAATLPVQRWIRARRDAAAGVGRGAGKI
jgi:hypothetical protein